MAQREAGLGVGPVADAATPTLLQRAQHRGQLLQQLLILGGGSQARLTPLIGSLRTGSGGTGSAGRGGGRHGDGTRSGGDSMLGAGARGVSRFAVSDRHQPYHEGNVL